MVIKFTCLWTFKHANYKCVLESVNGREEEKKRRKRGVGEMEEIDLVNKRSHCELNGHFLTN